MKGNNLYPTREYCGVLFITAASIFLPLLCHLFLCRFLRLFTRPEERQKGALLGGILGPVPLLIALAFWFNSAQTLPEIDKWFALMFSLGVYLLFAYTYFHFFNMSETAQRIRILRETSRAPSETQAEVEKAYASDRMITIRLQRLVALGELREKQGRYLIERGTLVPVARVVSALHDFIFPDPEGLRADLYRQP